MAKQLNVNLTFNVNTEKAKAQITLISSTSYVECDSIPILELLEFHNMVVDMYNKMNSDGKGGASNG